MESDTTDTYHHGDVSRQVVEMATILNVFIKYGESVFKFDHSPKGFGGLHLPQEMFSKSYFLVDDIH